MMNERSDIPDLDLSFLIPHSSLVTEVCLPQADQELPFLDVMPQDFYNAMSKRSAVSFQPNRRVTVTAPGGFPLADR
jgi:hypothetical protein